MKCWVLFLFWSCSSTKHFINSIDYRLCCPAHKYSSGLVIPVFSVFFIVLSIELNYLCIVNSIGKNSAKKASCEIQDAKSNTTIMKSSSYYNCTTVKTRQLHRIIATYYSFDYTYVKCLNIFPTPTCNVYQLCRYYFILNALIFYVLLT